MIFMFLAFGAVDVVDLDVPGCRINGLGCRSDSEVSWGGYLHGWVDNDVLFVEQQQ